MSTVEHDFQQDVLNVGDAIRSQTANGAVDQRKAVDISGDFEVEQVSTAGSQVYGVALYSVADGEQVAVAIDGCEVDIELGGSVSAGQSAAVDVDGNFVQAGGSASGDNVVGTFLEGGGDGDIAALYIDTTTGVPQ